METMLPLQILLNILLWSVNLVSGANILILHPLYAGSHDLVLR